jgi:tetratricopeptide (TPR) repeat protein
MKTFFTLSLLCLGVCVYSQNNKKRKPPRLTSLEIKCFNLVKQAEYDLNNGRLEQGKFLADSIIYLDPNLSDGYYIKARCETFLNQSDKAMSDYNRAIELYPLEPEYYDSRAMIEENHKMQEQALNDYSKAITLEASKNTKDRSSLGNYYEHRATFKYSLLDYDGAKEDCDKAILYWPELHLSYSLRASINFKNSNYLDAIKDCKKAIQLNPTGTDYEPYYTLGMCEVKLNRPENACEYFEKAKQLSNSYDVKSAINKYCN